MDLFLSTENNPHNYFSWDNTVVDLFFFSWNVRFIDQYAAMLEILLPFLSEKIMRILQLYLLFFSNLFI